MSNRNRWIEAEDAYLREARERGDTFAVIGSVIGRSKRSCNARYGIITGARRSIDETRRIVRERWLTTSPSDISSHLGVTATYVRKLAQMMRLGPSPFDKGGTAPVPTPSRPRGYTAAEIAWARENRTRSLEAFMIAGFAGGRV